MMFWKNRYRNDVGPVVEKQKKVWKGKNFKKNY